jgi:hypothetical protein
MQGEERWESAPWRNKEAERERCRGRGRGSERRGSASGSGGGAKNLSNVEDGVDCEGCVNILCEALRPTKDSAAVEAVLEALTKMPEGGIESAGMSDVVALMDVAGALAKLEQLQQHPERSTRLKATAMLQQYGRALGWRTECWCSWPGEPLATGVGGLPNIHRPCTAHKNASNFSSSPPPLEPIRWTNYGIQASDAPARWD